MRRNALFALLLLGSACFFLSTANADSFGSGANLFDIDFVTIGNPGNSPDANPNPAGAVNYDYRIGKYEISEQMIDKANALGGLAITKDTRGPDYPATSVTWYEAAKFVNWLNTSTGSTQAYKFDANGNFQLWQSIDAGYDPNNLYRNTLAKYFLPTVHEWHKAAYYNPSTGTYYTYPTGSSSVPDGIDYAGDPNFDAVFNDGYNQGAPNIITNVGVPSPDGTFGQGGNADEWIETAFDWLNNAPAKQRSVLGGDAGWPSTVLLASNSGIGWSPGLKITGFGFRVASVVPEPAAAVLGVYGFIQFVAMRRRGTRSTKVG